MCGESVDVIVQISGAVCVCTVAKVVSLLPRLTFKVTRVKRARSQKCRLLPLLSCRQRIQVVAGIQTAWLLVNTTRPTKVKANNVWAALSAFSPEQQAEHPSGRAGHSNVCMFMRLKQGHLRAKQKCMLQSHLSSRQRVQVVYEGSQMFCCVINS